MPVARSVSASQLAAQLEEEDGMSSCHGPGKGEEGRGFPNVKAHTLDNRLSKPSLNGYGEPRRKRSFMSFRLSKKSKSKDGSGSGGGGGGELIQGNGHHLPPPGLPDNVSLPASVASENGAESQEGSDSSCASVKPKKKYLTRVSSFVHRVAGRVQAGQHAISGGVTEAKRNKLERSRTISSNDLQTRAAEDYLVFEEGKVPGVMGVRNHGNTCFINAVVQCLSHTHVLAEYFVLDQYKQDIARCNKINSKKFGTRGEITEQLAVLLKALWTLRYVSDVSMNFKNTIDKYEAAYRGSQQHDAAEFLLFVLDKVHEDLNTAAKKKYKKIKNPYGRPDDVVAAETLANHLRCNSSFVHAIFQAQFRSSLKCPHCQRESNTFDPFLCVSIPIPQHQVRAVFVTVVYLNQQPKQVQLGLSVDAGATVRELRRQVAADCGLDAAVLLLTELDGEGFHRTFADNSAISWLGDSVYAIEMPPPKTPSTEHGAFVLITWVNVVTAQPNHVRFGGVYQSQVARDVSYADLQKLLLKEMTSLVTCSTLTSRQESGLFVIGVDDGGSVVEPLDASLDVPLYQDLVDQALTLCAPDAGPPHIKLLLQWNPETKQKYIVDDVDHIDEHYSVKELRQNPPSCASVSLHECFQLHTSAEKLGCGNAWHCPTCDRKQQVVKRLMLWSAPHILVCHLKRFRQGSLNSNSSKLNTMVKFPIKGFDIADHIASRSTVIGGPPAHQNLAKNTTNTSNKITTTTGTTTTGSTMGSLGMKDSTSVLGLSSVWSPWRKGRRLPGLQETQTVYDLYAVCNHHGKDLQGGHYTAVCLNAANNAWYSFDDSKVEEVQEDQVVTPDAYILFYQRRGSEGVDNTGKNHWAYRIPSSVLPQALKQDSSAPAKKVPAPFERGRSYGTLPLNAQNSRASSVEPDYNSDSEAPLATHEESPLLKKKWTAGSTELITEESPNSSNLQMGTVKAEVVTDQEEKKDEREGMADVGGENSKRKAEENLGGESKGRDSCDCSDMRSGSGNKVDKDSSNAVERSGYHGGEEEEEEQGEEEVEDVWERKCLVKKNTKLTVLISKSQALTQQELAEVSGGGSGIVTMGLENGVVEIEKEGGSKDVDRVCNNVEKMVNGHGEDHEESSKEINGRKEEEKEEGEEEEESESERTTPSPTSTPEVRIHPATPEVVAAHSSRSEAKKRSVITLTLRPKTSSESSGSETCQTPTTVISRSPSLTSASSQGSNQSLSLAQSPEMVTQCTTPEIHISSSPLVILGNGNGTEHFNVAAVTAVPPPPEFAQQPCQPSCCRPLLPHPLCHQQRPISTNCNKTPSFVVINTPTASPRMVRGKTSVMNGSSSPKITSQVVRTSGIPSSLKSNGSLPPQRTNTPSVTRSNGVYSRSSVRNSTGSLKDVQHMATTNGDQHVPYRNGKAYHSGKYSSVHMPNNSQKSVSSSVFSSNRKSTSSIITSKKDRVLSVHYDDSKSLNGLASPKETLDSTQSSPCIITAATPIINESSV